LGTLGQRQEVKVVGVFEQLAGEVGVGWWQGVGEVIERLALAVVQVAGICPPSWWIIASSGYASAKARM